MRENVTPQSIQHNQGNHVPYQGGDLLIKKCQFANIIIRKRYFNKRRRSESWDMYI